MTEVFPNLVQSPLNLQDIINNKMETWKKIF